MQVVYAIAGFAAGASAAAMGWVLGAPAWALVGSYVAAGGPGVVLTALAVHLATPPRRGGQGGRHARGPP
jgi:hypothetical protein